MTIGVNTRMINYHVYVERNYGRNKTKAKARAS